MITNSHINETIVKTIIFAPFTLESVFSYAKHKSIFGGELVFLR